MDKSQHLPRLSLKRKCHQLSHVHSSAVVSHGSGSALSQRVWPGSLGQHCPFLIPVLGPGGILWKGLMLFHSAECSEMLRIGDTCRTSKFFTDWLAEMEYTNGEWLPGRSPSLPEAAKPPEMMGKKGTCFPGSTRGYHGVYSARKPLRPAGRKGRKDSAKRRGCSQILHFIFLILQLYILALTDHSYREWKPLEKLTAETKGFKKNHFRFSPDLLDFSSNWERKKL